MKLSGVREISLHIGLLVLLALLTGRIIIHGISDYLLPAAYDGDESAVDSILSWQARHARASYLKAQATEQSDPQLSRQFIYRALAANPADVRPLAILASIEAQADNGAMADQLINLASARMPANKSLHLRAASYWIEQRNLEKALDEWHKALTIATELGAQLFPVFLKVLENRDIQASLMPYALQPPVWWDEFVAYVSTNTKQSSTTLLLYSMRQQSQQPLSADERRHMVKRAINDALWQQAYLIWVEGLDNSRRSSLAGVFDGSFEYARDKEPFGWQLSSTRYTKTSVRPAFGVHGKSALMIKFDNEELRYRHLYQRILLPAGDYSFSVNKRTSKLMGRGRLKWFVYCSGDDRIAGESRALLPSMEWEKMKFDFSIPADDACSSQVLRLETIGKHAFDHKLSGVLWLDDLRIERVRKPAGA